MDTANATMSVPGENICSICTKSVSRPRRFLLKGAVTIFCSKCAKREPTVPLVDENTEHIVCMKCSEIFTAGSAMRRHEKSQHSEEKPEFSCTACDKKYSRKHALDLHIEQHHKGESTKRTVANDSGWSLLDQGNSDETKFSSEMGFEDCFSLEPYDYPMGPVTPTLNVSTSKNGARSVYTPRKRKAGNDVNTSYNIRSDIQVLKNDTEDEGMNDTDSSSPLDATQSWLVALGLSLAKMPPVDQIEVKMAFANIIGKKELEILKRNA